MSKNGFLSMADIIEQFDHVDDADAAERAKTNRALAEAMDWLRPRNWHGSGLTPDDILPIATDSGIPVVWVPPTEVLVKVAAARPSDRIGVLVSHEDEVLGHCEALIARSCDPALCESQTLTGRALEAFRGGHHEAAMVLAVAVAERLAFWVSETRAMRFHSQEEWDEHEEKLGPSSFVGMRVG